MGYDVIEYYLVHFADGGVEGICVEEQVVEGSMICPACVLDFIRRMIREREGGGESHG